MAKFQLRPLNEKTSYILLNIKRQDNALRPINVCTKETWDDVMQHFPTDVRYKAANLAAHNYDVVLFEDSLFIGGYGEGKLYEYDGSCSDLSPEDSKFLYPNKDDIDFSKFGIKGKLFDLANKALILHYKAISNIDWDWLDVKGEKLPYDRKTLRIKNGLQNFWDKLKPALE